MPVPIPISFIAGVDGPWIVQRVGAVTGDALPSSQRLRVVEGSSPSAFDAQWVLRGLVSNLRYAERDEVDVLALRQEGLARKQATCAALIPIRKSDAWWSLAQDERRAIFEKQSRHIAIGLRLLPAVARQLHHSRDLGEPFDFLTWFEYAPEHASAFEDMVAELRQTPEWHYVIREVDIRLSRFVTP